MTKNLGGRPSLLTEERVKTILDCIEKGDAIPGQVAAFAEITPHLLRDWLRNGASDIKNGIDSIYARFSTQYRKKCAEVIKQYVHPVKTCAKNWQAALEMLKVTCRNDFRPEFDAIEQMQEEMGHFKLLMEQHKSGQGDLIDVKVNSIETQKIT